MENLNAEEIINGLLQNDSTYVEDKECIRKAIRLIKELAEANATQIVTAIELDKQVERLTEENERLSTALANYDRQTEVRIAEEYYTAEAYDELREENERLSNDKEYWKSRAEDAELEYDKAVKKGYAYGRADTVREFAERFKELMGGEFASCGYCNAVGYWSVKAVKDNIDRIAKEILNNTEDEEE